MIDFQIEDVLMMFTPITVITAIISGFLLGHLYHRQMNTSASCFYTTYVAGVAFMLTVGFARSYESPTWERWIGAALLYTLFTLMSAIGRKI